MSKRIAIILVTITILLVITVSVGMSYALWKQTLTQEEINVVKAGCLNITIQNENNTINLENALPVTDADGLKIAPYTFEITNTCYLASAYQINLELLNGTTMTSSLLRYKLDGYETKNVGELEIGNKTIANSVDSRILHTGAILGNTTKSFKLNIWMDENVTLEEGKNKVLNAKIVIENLAVSEEKALELLIGETWVFDYTGGEQEFIAPVAGTYKIETWGAQGGKGSWGVNTFNRIGGYGGYSSGVIYLNKGDILYINVGGQGNSMYDVGSIAGGYNGGGSGYYEREAENSGSGGGATHIATKSGLLSNLKSSVDDILIVAGGGGGGATCGSLDNGNVRIDIFVGGSGGGYLGTSNISNTASGGTQNDSGSMILQSLVVSETGTTTPINHLYSVGSFGQGGNDIGYQKQTCGSTAGGGGGFYGGVASNYSGTGGSGYIGNLNLFNKVMYCYNCTTSNDVPTKTISTTNVSEQPISNYAKKGNGYARITYLGKE